jgi:uncharacterized protein
MSDVEVRTFKEIDLQGGTIVEAFPSVGLVSTIAASYMIAQLGLDQVCALDSNGFPPLSMIYARKPKFPARVYADGQRRFAVFICEVPLPTRMHRPVANCLLDWAKEQGARRIVSLEGLPLPKEETKEEIHVWGVGSTEAAREDLEAGGVAQLETGMIAGVSGVLLNEGRWRGFNVISLLAEARPYMPDAFAAMRLVEVVDRFLTEIEVDLGPLEAQARAIEGQLRTMREEAKPAMAEPAAGMFR